MSCDENHEAAAKAREARKDARKDEKTGKRSLPVVK